MFSRPHLVFTSSLITPSPSLVDPALMSVVREVDGQETGLSVQPAEKKSRLQTGQDFIYRAHWPRLLCFKSISRPASSKERDLGRHIQSANRVSFQPITKQVTCFHRPGRSEVRSSELTSTVTTVPALQTRPCCR